MSNDISLFLEDSPIIKNVTSPKYKGEEVLLLFDEPNKDISNRIKKAKNTPNKFIPKDQMLNGLTPKIHKHRKPKSTLKRKLFQDPRPKSQGAASAATPAHLGDPALDTADWAEPTADTFGPGNMRVDFLLPSADVTVSDAGVFWPAPTSADHALALAASRHRLVWIDIKLP